MIQASLICNHILPHVIMSDALQNKKGYVNYNNKLLVLSFFLFEAKPLAASLRST